MNGQNKPNARQKRVVGAGKGIEKYEIFSYLFGRVFGHCVKTSSLPLWVLPLV